jgi:hypothetical protein
MDDSQAHGPFIGITIEGLLRPCEIYPVQTACGYGFVWEWSALEQETRSKRSFDLFFDCLDDARRHGYEPHFLDRGHAAELAVVPVAA